MSDHANLKPDRWPGAPIPPQDDSGGNGGGYDGDMRERVAVLETLVKTLATKSDFEALRADLEKGQKENRTWMLGTVLALFLGVLAAGNFIAGGLKEYRPAAAAPPQPSVIVIPPSAATGYAPAAQPPQVPQQEQSRP